MLQEQDRLKLDGIVQQMIANNEPDTNIRFVVEDFKQKYTKPADTNTFGNIKADIATAGGRVQRAIAGEGEFAGQTPVRRGVEATAAAFGAVPKVAADVMPEWIKDAMRPIGELIQKGFNIPVEALSETKLFKEASKYPEYTKTLEEVLGTVAPTGEISGTILAAGSVKPTVDIAKTGIAKTKEIVSPYVKQLPAKAEQNLASNLNETFKKGTIGVKSISDYAESRGINLGEEIVSRKIKPIVENDRLKFGTEPFKLLDDEIAADSKILDDVIAQYKDTKVPAHELKLGVASQIASDSAVVRQGAVQDLTEKALKKIDEMVAQTGRADFTLPEIQNFKKGMWEASKKFKPTEVGKSDAYSQLGTLFKNIIEKEVPDVNVRDINAKIGRTQETYKLLEKINSLQDGGIVLKGGKIGKYGSEAIGAGTGAVIGSSGGPIGTAVGIAAGYKIADLIRGLSQKSAILGPLDRILIKFAKDAPEDIAIREAKIFLNEVKAGKQPNLSPSVIKTLEKAWSQKEKAFPIDTPIEMEMGTYKLTKNKTTGRVEMKFKPKNQPLRPTETPNKKTNNIDNASVKSIPKSIPQSTIKSKIRKK